MKPDYIYIYIQALGRQPAGSDETNNNALYLIYKCSDSAKVMHISDRAIPVGSTVVVVGANGYMAVETCEKLLEAGYQVRGAVRDVDRHRAWMHRLFDKQWSGKFELVQVPDFEATGAFDEAFKGICTAVHLYCADD